jgi:hypothetical protein
VPKASLPKIPALVEQKLTKTGYTRGATTREIYQNRVTRNNTVLIQWRSWTTCKTPDDGSGQYEKGSIVLLEPSWYMQSKSADDELAAEGLEVGANALLLFLRRSDWVAYRPRSGKLPNGKPFAVATSRETPLGGVYFARVHATVADDGLEVVQGYDNTRLRGAGIRVYEYASTTTIMRARCQLEALIWLCEDAETAMRDAGMDRADVRARRDLALSIAETSGLLDLNRLRTIRALNGDDRTVCPLCLEPVSVADIMSRSMQAEGREVYDLTTTEVGLFHIDELRVGRLQHKPYNLGWGHHYCNVVAKDAGIMPTLEWMQRVLVNQGYQNDPSAERAAVENAVGR